MNSTDRMQYQIRLANILVKAGKNKRYYHSLQVAQMAEDMAKRFGLDADKAYLSGLLHDIARSLPTNQLFYLAGLAQIPIKEIYWGNPALMHAPVGAYLLQRDFGIEDQEILASVRNHTLGAPQMSGLDKIIYLADMLEPGRKWQGIEVLRELADRDLDIAMKEALLQSIDWLKEKGKRLDSQTLEAYEYFCKLVAKKDI